MLVVRVAYPDGIDHDLLLEHSLRTVSKWESSLEKPFLSAEEKTPEDMVHYLKCMIVSPEYPEDLFSRLTQENWDLIQKYITAKMTAMYLPPGKPSRDVMTVETIMYLMLKYGIPLDPCQDWHLNRLLALIQKFNVMDAPKKKRSHAEMAAERQAMNARRKAQLGTSG